MLIRLELVTKYESSNVMSNLKADARKMSKICLGSDWTLSSCPVSIKEEEAKTKSFSSFLFPFCLNHAHPVKVKTILQLMIFPFRM